MSPDLAKEKDEDTGERATSSPRHRPELLLSRLSPSASPNSPSLPLPNRPKKSFLVTHNSILSSTSVSSTKAKRARSYATITEGEEVLKKKLMRLLEGSILRCNLLRDGSMSGFPMLFSFFV